MDFFWLVLLSVDWVLRVFGVCLFIFVFAGSILDSTVKRKRKDCGHMQSNPRTFYCLLFFLKQFIHFHNDF